MTSTWSAMGGRQRAIQWIGMIGLSAVLLMVNGCSGGGTGDVANVGAGRCASNKTCPTANAGPDQTVLVGSKVTLDGDESYSVTAGPVTYQWTLIAKPEASTASLLGATTVRPTFTADVEGTYTAKLVVDNGGNHSNPDTVNITAGTANLPPIADAGTDRTVLLGTVVMLNGTASYDPNGTSVTHSWAITARPPHTEAILSNATTATPSFTADVVGSYRLRLSVSDGILTSAPDMIEITVATGNIAPVADAGPDQQVSTGQLITLTGAGSSDANGDALTYSWQLQSKPADSTASLTNPTTVNPSFTPDFAGFYVLSLVVTDGQLDSTVDTVVIDAKLPSFVNAVLQAYLKASNTDTGDSLGSSVALDGDTLVVGAPQEGSCGTGINGDQSNNGCSGAGAAYVFTRTAGVWSQQAYLKASNTEWGDQFGNSVALDGDTLVVGAPLEDSCATGINGNQANNSCEWAGAVYVFTRTAGVWSQQAYIKASNADNSLPYGDYFGWRLALDGNTLAVSALQEDSCATGINGDQSNNSCLVAGAVYVFTRSAGVWSQQAYVKASNTGPIEPFGSNDTFGSSLALDGDTLVVGAPLEDSCATGINGNQGDNSCTNSGAVYMFTRTAGVWSQQAYVKASNTGAGDSFGSSVVLSGDTLVVGASGEASCATGINGNQGDNSCFGAGAVYVFTRTAGVLSQRTYVKASNTGSPSAAGNFGSSMALVDNILAVGSYGQSLGSGAVYMFASISGVWSQQAFVKAPNADRLDFFGSSVALSGDTLAVGAPGEDSCATGINGNQGDNSCGPSENEAAPGAGAAYVYGGQ